MPLDGLSAERLASGCAGESIFEVLFVQTIKIFATVNRCYGVDSEMQKEDFSSSAPLLMIALARLFCAEPQRYFWELDEHIASTIPSLIDLAVATEELVLFDHEIG